MIVAKDLEVGSAEAPSILVEDGNNALTTAKLRAPAAPTSTWQTLLKAVFFTEN